MLAEDRSDADVLAVLIKRILGKASALVLKKGFGGCGDLCHKAAREIVNFANQGATHFIICHDADDNVPAHIKKKVFDKLSLVLNPMQYQYRIIVPIQELEAWIIADEKAIQKVIPSLSIKPQRWPETRNSPKEWLVSESRKGRSRPLYEPTIWNAKVATYLNIETLNAKCSSFKEFHDFVKQPMEEAQ